MSRALPGEHLCKEHQGNHSHYDPHNCTVCRLRALLNYDASLGTCVLSSTAPSKT